jgi:hypothetical protein
LSDGFCVDVAPRLVDDIKLLAVEGLHSFITRTLNPKPEGIARVEDGSSVCDSQRSHKKTQPVHFSNEQRKIPGH